MIDQETMQTLNRESGLHLERIQPYLAALAIGELREEEKAELGRVQDAMVVTALLIDREGPGKTLLLPTGETKTVMEAWMAFVQEFERLLKRAALRIAQETREAVSQEAL